MPKKQNTHLRVYAISSKVMFLFRLGCQYINENCCIEIIRKNNTNKGKFRFNKEFRLQFLKMRVEEIGSI